MERNAWIASKKAWASKWAKMREEYLRGRLPQVEVKLFGGTYRWTCPVCGEIGSPTHSEAVAANAGAQHAQVHASEEDLETLENMKVRAMPEHLLTPFQRRRREQLENETDTEPDTN